MCVDIDVCGMTRPSCQPDVDVHVDVRANLDHCLALAAHPDDALIVAGDVCPDEATFEKLFSSLVAKFKYVFYCPGNHDLWIHERDPWKNSLDKFFGQLLVCDRLGVIAHHRERQPLDTASVTDSSTGMRAERISLTRPPIPRPRSVSEPAWSPRRNLSTVHSMTTPASSSVAS